MQRYKPIQPPIKLSPAPNKKKLFSFLVLIIIIAFLFSGWFVIQILNSVNLKSSATFTITRGEGANQISRRLKEAGIIRSQFAFESYAFLKGVEGDFKAGEYDLPSVVNIKRLTEILVAGRPAKEWKLTIPEGWSIYDIAFKLESLGKFQAEEFFEATGYNQPQDKFVFDTSIYDFFNDKPTKTNLEGYLFPDTYKFFTYSSIDDILRKMLNNFGSKMTLELRQSIKEQGKTIHEILTVASIIEREVRTDQDRPLVAGIFWKRLNAGIALQADSTINYITHKKMQAVSIKDLAIDSAYNTYKYAGLPPGPICNPGLASIKAAIYPRDSDYWYFLTDRDGKVYYAKDFEGHKANKTKYL